MSAPTRRRETRRKNACKLLTTSKAAAAASVLAATVVVFGSGGTISCVGGGVDAFTTLSPSLTGHSPCARTHPISLVTSRRRSLFVMVPRVHTDNTLDSNSEDGTEGAPIIRAKMTTPSSAAYSPLLPRLSLKQEIYLLRRMRDYPSHSEESQSARQSLLLHNLPLVQSIVTKLLKSRGIGVGRIDGLSSPIQHQSHQNPMSFAREDLIHEGTIGLAEAIDRYDLAYAPSEDSGEEGGGVEGGGVARLGTYATYWIRARVLRAMQRGEHSLVRFPEHAVQASHRLVKAAREIGMPWDEVVMLAEQKPGEDRNLDSIADSSKSDIIIKNKLREKLRIAAGIATDGLFRDAVRVRSMSRASSTTPLESWMVEYSTPLDLTTAVADGIAIDDNLLGQEHIVETLSKFLIPREVEVLSLRYGLVSPSFSSEVDSVGVDEAKLLSQPAVRTGASYRNYEAEAEEELFGPGGMLSHYSKMPSTESNISKNSSTTNGIGRIIPPSTVATATSTTPPGLSANPSLLPFREIGRRMEFSAEYCRRTCSAALVKLTRAAEEGRLAESDFLLGW